MSPVASYPYTWHWRTKHGERHRQPCRVWARGSMNSIGVEFADGFRTVTARFAVRKGPLTEARPLRLRYGARGTAGSGPRAAERADRLARA